MAVLRHYGMPHTSKSLRNGVAPLILRRVQRLLGSGHRSHHNSPKSVIVYLRYTVCSTLGSTTFLNSEVDQFNMTYRRVLMVPLELFDDQASQSGDV